jgi:hypothetical protein
MKRTKAVQKQHQPTGKRLGGCTGRGFMPGQSGNPGGRRKSVASLTAVLKRLLSQSDAEQIAARLILLAKRGSLRAVEILLDRLDHPLAGPFAVVSQSVNVTQDNHLAQAMRNVPTPILLARIQRDFEELGQPAPLLLPAETQPPAPPPTPEPRRTVEPEPDDPPAARGVVTAQEFLA